MHIIIDGKTYDTAIANQGETLNGIMDMFNTHNKIGLIKSYRFLSNMGLKESKDVIDAAPTLDAVLLRFAPFFPVCDAPKPKKVLSEDQKLKKQVVKGMITAMNVWEAMAFDTSLDACQAVLTNMKNRRNM